MPTPDSITISGAREHNLKNLSLTIPKNKLVVFTGLSGSGKSSLAFDTLYAEGQRRYVESLSSYARQFLGVMSKPDVDQIDGLSPAISIDQKTTSHNPRSTVGTITEIYDYLRLLYARVGTQYCPDCSIPITTQSVDEIINKVESEVFPRLSKPVRLLLLSPVVRDRKGEFHSLFTNLQKQGYSRVRIDGEMYGLNDDLVLIKTNQHTIEVVIDRLMLSSTEVKDAELLRQWRSRLAQGVETALKLADGICSISIIGDDSLEFPDKPLKMEDITFSEKRSCSQCGRSFPELEPRLFSFNSPQGACEACHGLGSILKIDTDKLIAPTLSLSEGAIIPFARVLSADTWWARLVRTVAQDEGIEYRKTPYYDLTDAQKNILLHGSPKIYTVEGENRFGNQTTIQEKFEGFITNLERRYRETDSNFMQQEIGQFMSKQECAVCHGDRLNDVALAVLIHGKTIAQTSHLPIIACRAWIEALMTGKILTNQQLQIAESVVKEVQQRLLFLVSVGLEYLSLDREAATLAGGEAQRIRLASQIGTGLSGVLYILDEPTIGLHQRDNHRLIETLKQLQEKGNTVIVVEHDRDIMLAADCLFDFGPGAGVDGGQIVSQGKPSEVQADNNSLTGKYLSRKKEVTRHKTPKRLLVDEPIARQEIRLVGATHHNLKSIDVNIPLNTLSCITGVSGSGKSTLLYETLYAQLAKKIGYKLDFTPGAVDQVMIPDQVKRVTLIDQSPIGKTPRSNPATYTKLFDYVRQVFAATQDARIRGYAAGRFSFNVKGGRCEACQGDGQIKIEMQFLPDIYVTCDVCQGRRYNRETLEVTYKDKTVAEVLAMSVDDAAVFFEHHSAISQKLTTLQAVGLGYIKLGQSAPTLSGGEAQRVKLAKELSTRSHDHVVYLLDEPTTGLHFADVQKLLDVLVKLVEQDNTVVVIEHNLDIIKNADWIIDLGPEGGDRGGELVAAGTPEMIASDDHSHTGRYLKAELANL